MRILFYIFFEGKTDTTCKLQLYLFTYYDLDSCGETEENITLSIPAVLARLSQNNARLDTIEFECYFLYFY